jgi:hypothetical protein
MKRPAKDDPPIQTNIAGSVEKLTNIGHVAGNVYLNSPDSKIKWSGYWLGAAVAGLLLPVLGVSWQIASLRSSFLRDSAQVQSQTRDAVQLADRLAKVNSAQNETPAIAKARSEIAASAPSIEEGYLILSPSLLRNLESRRKKANRNATAMLAYPFYPNSIMDSEFQPGPTFPQPDEIMSSNEIAVTCLYLRQTGARKSDSVNLIVEKGTLTAPVSIQEQDGEKTADRRVAIRAAAKGLKETPIDLGPLDTGEGTLIPLFMTRRLRNAQGRITGWQVISHNVYLPRKLAYTDSLTHETLEKVVREMHAPKQLDTGVYGRN